MRTDMKGLCQNDDTSFHRKELERQRFEKKTRNQTSSHESVPFEKDTEDN